MDAHATQIFMEIVLAEDGVLANIANEVEEDLWLSAFKSILVECISREDDYDSEMCAQLLAIGRHRLEKLTGGERDILRKMLHVFRKTARSIQTSKTEAILNSIIDVPIDTQREFCGMQGLAHIPETERKAGMKQTQGCGGMTRTRSIRSNLSDLDAIMP